MTTAMFRILVIEDDDELRSMLRTLLESQSYRVSEAASGQRGILEARSYRPDLALVDLGLPDLDGTEVVRAIRSFAPLLILVLTARTMEADKVLALDAGADDYVTKPFSPRELLLRVKKILARIPGPEPVEEQLRYGDLLIDLPRHLASWRGKTVDLTATEFRLLTLLAQRAGRVQSRDQLLRDVWEYDSMIDTRTVDTHMRRLREKLGPAAKHLDTVRGVGYRFVE